MAMILPMFVFISFFFWGLEYIAEPVLSVRWGRWQKGTDYAYIRATNPQGKRRFHFSISPFANAHRKR
jgi:hypothetical protein